MAGRSKKIDPTTGEPVAPKPAEPRPLYLVYQTDGDIVNEKGQINADVFVFSSRNAKDALNAYAEDPANRHFIQLMVK